jgi:hypothetical protein
MGKYGGLSGEYNYKKKAQALKALRAARKHAKIEVSKGGKGYNIKLTGSRGWWTLSITKKKK